MTAPFRNVSLRARFALSMGLVLSAAAVILVVVLPSAATAAAQDPQSFFWTVVTAGVALVAVGSGAAFVIGTLLGRQLRTLSRTAKMIAEQGDLTQTFEATGDREIVALATSLTQLVGRLKEIPSSLFDSVQILGISVANLDLSTQEQSETVTRQAAALQETQITAQEIKQTSLVAANKAEMVLKVAERAESVSKSGEEAIEQSLSGLTDIRAQVEEIAHKITAVGERTRQIGVITQTVKDLADQSNMLALNAAIEAVRSGEHGKGFTVVAREIRSLANQSIEATARVREILEDITNAIQIAVTSSQAGAQKMEQGLLQVKASGENLRELSNIVKDNSSAVRQIAAAVSQQNAGIMQIFGAVTELSTMMDDTVKRLGTTTEAALNLKDVSKTVSSVVGSYRI